MQHIDRFLINKYFISGEAESSPPATEKQVEVQYLHRVFLIFINSESFPWTHRGHTGSCKAKMPLKLHALSQNETRYPFQCQIKYFLQNIKAII